jgi:hypothetical protein
MNFLVSILFILSTSLPAHSRSGGPRISEPREFQYIHCTKTEPFTDKLVDHYVIDIKNKRQPKLYFSLGPVTAKTSELRSLRLLDQRLVQSASQDFDIIWTSTRLNLKFELQIADNGGQVLNGVLTQNGQSSFVRCLDSALE